jgi:hypothetical protein
MAKIMKKKLSWKASRSAQTTGYKLYWARQGELGYESTCEYLGQVTEVIIPDGLSTFKPATGPYEFGIVAVDDSDNESDMTIITVPFHFIAPQAPEEVHIEGLAADGDRGQISGKILASKGKVKAPEKGEEVSPQKPSADSKPTPAATEDGSLEFFETDRADAGIMFTKKDLEIFEADLKL